MSHRVFQLSHLARSAVQPSSQKHACVTYKTRGDEKRSTQRANDIYLYTYMYIQIPGIWAILKQRPQIKRRLTEKRECLRVTYCGGFKRLQLGMFFIPCHKHLHAGLDATSETDCKPAEVPYLVDLSTRAFLGETLMLTAGSTVLGVTSPPAAAQLNPVSPILATRWRERRTPASQDWVPPPLFFFPARQKHKFTSLSRYLQTAVMVQ